MSALVKVDVLIDLKAVDLEDIYQSTGFQGVSDEVFNKVVSLTDGIDLIEKRTIRITASQDFIV